MKKDQQPISTDPNNIKWINDKSKFGLKMLEKMGWKEGKGLGKKEDGKKENIKISKKIDNRGLGKGETVDVSTKIILYNDILKKLEPIGIKKETEIIKIKKKKHKYEKRIENKIKKKTKNEYNEIFGKDE